MAVAHDDLPAAPVDADQVAVHDAPERRGRLANTQAVGVAARTLVRDLRGVQPVRGEQLGGAGSAVSRQAQDEGAGGEILGLAHPQLDAEALGQPAGQAEVIGVVVGDDETPDRTPRQRPGEDLLPQIAGGSRVQATIHQRPAGLVSQHPQVDVIQREGQRHAQPEHPRRHLHSGARRGNIRKGELQRCGRGRIGLGEGSGGIVHGGRWRRRDVRPAAPNDCRS